MTAKAAQERKAAETLPDATARDEAALIARVQAGDKELFCESDPPAPAPRLRRGPGHPAQRSRCRGGCAGRISKGAGPPGKFPEGIEIQHLADSNRHQRGAYAAAKKSSGENDLSRGATRRRSRRRRLPPQGFRRLARDSIGSAGPQRNPRGLVARAGFARAKNIARCLCCATSNRSASKKPPEFWALPRVRSRRACCAPG